MYKAIIVDDEELTREGLRAEINWRELGIEIAAEAENGVRALELVKEIKPDILLTDIRMPKMDGLKLALHVRELFPDMQIIFLSAYSDKEYLKSAIQLKAVDYVEKPFDECELLETVKKAVSALESTKSKTREIAKIRDSLRQNIFYLKQKLALNLISSDNRGFSDKEFETIAPGLVMDSFFVSIVIKMNLFYDDMDHHRDTREKITDIIVNILESSPFGWIAGFMDYDRIVLHLYGDSINDSNKIADLMDEIKKAIQEKCCDSSISIGIGDTAKGINEVARSFQEALSASERQFYQGSGRIFHWSNKFKAGKFSFDHSILKKIKDSLDAMRIDEVVSVLEDMTCKVLEKQDPDISHVRNAYFSILFKFYEWIMDEELLLSDNERDRDFLWNAILKINTVVQLSEYVKNEIKTLKPFVINNSSKRKEGTVKDILSYIGCNYTGDITIKSIAEHLYLTHTYLCLVFKKDTGKTINNYITELRIEKSKELLADRTFSMLDVAERSGFNNSKYYSRVFKKMTGINPSDYREKLMGQ